MVMVEALVCGTPVIGFPEGAEIVIDGVNGMLVNDGAEMARAVERLGRSTHETAVRASPSATTRRSPPPATSASTDERSTPIAYATHRTRPRRCPDASRSRRH